MRNPNMTSRLKEIIIKKEKRKARLLTSMHSIVNQLKDFGALKIICFGSVAKDKVDVNSDLDLFVIMPVSKSGKEWMNFIYEHVERTVASDIIAYNEKEFQEKFKRSRFLQNVLKGHVLYEKTGE